MTTLPIIPKGIQSAADALLALRAGCKAIYVSNHGGRQLDTAPHPLEVLIEIREHASHVFEKMEVFADGGARYGTDIIKMLALGAKAVGMGRPFAFSSIYGKEGVVKLIDMLKREVWIDMANLGVTKIEEIGEQYVSYNPAVYFIATMWTRG